MAHTMKPPKRGNQGPGARTLRVQYLTKRVRGIGGELLRRDWQWVYRDKHGNEFSHELLDRVEFEISKDEEVPPTWDHKNKRGHWGTGTRSQKHNRFRYRWQVSIPTRSLLLRARAIGGYAARLPNCFYYEDPEGFLYRTNNRRSFRLLLEADEAVHGED